MAGKSWIKLWLTLRSNERFTQLSDAEKWGYVDLLMVGESVAYTFANEGQLKALVGHSYRYAKKLREVGLLDGLTVYQGARRQAAIDPNAKVRQDRYKDRHRPVINGHHNGRPLNPEQQSYRVTEEVNTNISALPPGVKERLKALADDAAEFLGRTIRKSEIPVLTEWAAMTRDGEFVELREIIGHYRRKMRETTPEGALPAYLNWSRDAVLTLARGDQKLAGIQEIVDRLNAERAEVTA